MNNQKFFKKSVCVLFAAILLAGCGAPATISTTEPVLPPPATPTSEPPPGPTSGSLFNLVREVQVTPSGGYLNADFVRIGYVPGLDRMVVTFGTMLNQDEGGCSGNSYDAMMNVYREYAYKEYTVDMQETGKSGIVSCHGTSDTGGFFMGDDFYLASAETQNNLEGWYLAKYNAVTWTSSAEFFYQFNDPQLRAGDPSVAFVNGQIDVSSVDDASGGTHHNFFTPDLRFVNTRLLADVPNQGFSSLMTLGGTTYFLTSRAGTGGDPWAVILLQYDPHWNYLGEKTLIEDAATPQGLAFDGSRFYVAYTWRSEGIPFVENVHLAAFNMNWNLIEDIALTNFTLQDQTSSIHPWLALKDNRLYVSYSQNDPAGGIETLQAYVKVYELNPNP